MRLHACPWRNAVAWVALVVTAGTWVPFFYTAGGAGHDPDEEDFDYAQPGPPVGAHDVVPTAAGGKVVDLTKHPKKPVSPPTGPTPTPPSKPTTHKPPKTQHVDPPPVATTQASIIKAFLRAQVGEDYAWGANGPDDWDCSGLSLAALARVGVDLPRTSELQSTRGYRVSMNNLKVGDLLFWGLGPGLAYHVTVYIGDGKFIGAQNPSVGVVERSLSYDPPDFARRVL